MSSRRSYIPIAAAGIEIPWMIVIAIAMFVAVGDAPQPASGPHLNLVLWAMVGVIPAALGVVAAIAGAVLRWPQSRAQWIWLAVGAVVCLAMTLQWGTPNGVIE